MLRIRDEKQDNKVCSKCWVLVQRAEGQARKKVNKGVNEKNSHLLRRHWGLRRTRTVEGQQTFAEAWSPSVLTQVTPPLHVGFHIPGLKITYIVFTLTQ